MNSAFQTLRRSQPALGPNDAPLGRSAKEPSLPRFEDDTTIYYRRAHQARSEAFRGVFAALADAILRTPEKTSRVGDRIHTWLFTPFYSGGQKS